MARPCYRILGCLLLVVALVTACATVLPPEYVSSENGRELPGPILALAGEGNIVIAANPDGVHIRRPDGEWDRLEVPGISNYRKVTSLAVGQGEICVGTDGEGLYILSGGTWEVKTARYGGLPDDSVQTLAYDGDQDGLPGSNLWVGTDSGIAVRAMGQWTIYKPGDKWLVDLAGDSPKDVEKTYIGSGYKLGQKGEDSRYFRPPVTAIGIGPDRVVFGNNDSRIAIAGPAGVSIVRMLEDIGIVSLQVEDSVIWVGTTGGLVWGGVAGEVVGEPWPAYRNNVFWMGRLFGTRNSRPYEYRWNLVGFNTGKVPSIAVSGDSLWVAYGKRDGKGKPVLFERGDTERKPITDVRRYINVHEYIARKEAFAYESYGKNDGISGDPTAVLNFPDRGELWIGTAKGLYRLER